MSSARMACSTALTTDQVLSAPLSLPRYASAHMDRDIYVSRGDCPWLTVEFLKALWLFCHIFYHHAPKWMGSSSCR